ncbi:MAG TPA: PAS domain S-box protein, partial [Bryobacteraceae bacterium]|nr:PAS domain S-box protein [Bryobacteraceae bacterium]
MSYIFENVTETVREPLLVLDADLRVRLANRAFYRIFHLQSVAAVGHSVFELGDGQWDLPALRSLLDSVLTAGSSFDDFQVEHEFPETGRRIILMMNARLIQDQNPASPMILLAIEDVTERRETEERLQELTRRLQRSNEELREF